MMNHDTALLELVKHMRRGLPNHPDRFREALEDSLVPMIRCALRTGKGNPSLVRWVCQQEVPAKLTDPTSVARPMARLLCDRLLERLDPISCRETVFDS